MRSRDTLKIRRTIIRCSTRCVTVEGIGRRRSGRQGLGVEWMRTGWRQWRLGEALDSGVLFEEGYGDSLLREGRGSCG